MQSMCPPSIWSKDGAREPLEFIKFRLPAHCEDVVKFKRTIFSAIGMISRSISARVDSGTMCA